MQRTTINPEDPVAVLVERVRSNRLTLEDTALRLSVACSVIEERRTETERLLVEARQGLVSLRDGGFGSQRWPLAR